MSPATPSRRRGWTAVGVRKFHERARWENKRARETRPAAWRGAHLPGRLRVQAIQQAEHTARVSVDPVGSRHVFLPGPRALVVSSRRRSAVVAETMRSVQENESFDGDSEITGDSVIGGGAVAASLSSDLAFVPQRRVTRVRPRREGCSTLDAFEATLAHEATVSLRAASPE